MTDSGGSLTEREVQRIVGLIEALERSSFDSLEVEVDGLKLTLGRGGSGSSSPTGISSAAHAPSQPAVGPAPTTIKTIPSPTAPSLPPAKAQGRKTQNDHPNAKEVLAPLRGIFYGRPDPSSPPFVTLGSKVSAIATIGLVEVMKVFNAVPAGHEGEVVEICADDGQAVDAGQVLLRIAPGKASA